MSPLRLRPRPNFDAFISPDIGPISNRSRESCAFVVTVALITEPQVLYRLTDGHLVMI